MNDLQLLFPLILDGMDHGVIVFDSSMAIVWTNKKAQSLIPCGCATFENLADYFNLNADLSLLKEKTAVSIAGRTLEFSGKPLPVENRFYTILTIADRTEIEHLENENYCFTNVLNTMNEGTMISDTRGIVWFYNQQLQRSEGICPENVIGRHITEIYQVSIESSEHLSILRDKKPVIDRYSVFLTADGREISAIYSAYPIIRNGQIISVFSIGHNRMIAQALLNRYKNFQDQDCPSLASGELNNNTRFHLTDIIGESIVLRETLERARKAAMVDVPVLVWGETGTGKELFVQGIHNENPLTSSYPFIAINCAAIPEALLESLLFGTTKGSFTGSVDTIGIIEQSGKGTLYLDEINSMPINLQAKLLRVLQEKRFRKLGGKVELPLECRIFSSTNISPQVCVDNGSIRKDLYYRLAVITLELPNLLARKEDIPLLVHHFVQRFSAKYRKKIKGISPDLIDALINYSWPGNIRELEHILESAITMMDNGQIILPQHFPPSFIAKLGQLTPEHRVLIAGSLSDFVQQTEKQAIISLLEDCRWNVSQSAKRLQIRRQDLQYRMKKYGIVRK